MQGRTMAGTHKKKQRPANTASPYAILTRIINNWIVGKDIPNCLTERHTSALRRIFSILFLVLF